MKDIIASLLIMAVLIAVFSTFDAPVEAVSSTRGGGTQIQGDSGTVLPGDGSDPVEALETATTEPTPEAAVVRLGTAKAETEATEPTEAEPAQITKDDIFKAFLVGAVLFGMGQIVAMLIIALCKYWG